MTRPVQWLQWSFDSFLPEEGMRLLVSQEARIYQVDAFALLEYLGAERLTKVGIEPSVGSVGDSCDNALAEPINGPVQGRDDPSLPILKEQGSC